MKRYVLTAAGIDGLKIENVAEPGRPGHGQVLVKMRAASLNFRDLMVTSGIYGMDVPNQVILSDGAGEVVAVGDGVSRVKSGDRVALTFHIDWIGGQLTPAHNVGGRGGAGNDGALQEYALVSQNEVAILPAHLSFEEGATLPCAAVTAWTALSAYGATRPGDVVLTQGTGGVSLFAVQLAKLFGARVIATSSSTEKLERLKALGADEVIDYTKTPDWHLAVLEMTGGNGADVVVDVGGKGTLQKSLMSARQGGRISVVGLLAGMPEVGAEILLRYLTVQGSRVGSLEHFEQMNRAIGFHQLRPVIDRVFAFDDAPAALKHLQAQKHVGKVVIRIA
ncbi:MAG: NAD(P)-dependent alcohol dehydrogenase [Rhodocyclaceae bacterium]|nr:NAD(P)-dependent alcohol dehydrogenase [Rhodocyclaceae bacterium]